LERYPTGRRVSTNVAKFHERYRLFYRFSRKEKVIVYAWVNDEGTLRKAGSKSDPYAVFCAMLDSGNPPSAIAELLAFPQKWNQTVPHRNEQFPHLRKSAIADSARNQISIP
jgi:hypothetical protein